ncbi:hypothetical protein [uncultured Hyphomonas sp.]|uniref:hypothetical protein n=1 Tax=uncultured Hyphomonas sp. TaxID=225298 RepID=UPI002AAC41E6|nr:hypothetical protein [uncultured Hyphomonas sp.]
MNFRLKNKSTGVSSWKLVLIVGLAMTVFLAGGAQAQAAMTQVEEDASDEAVFDLVTVTARRVEAISDTLLTVTAFGKTLIETGALEIVTDIVALSPNESFEPGGDFVSSNIAVRCASLERSTEEPGIGVYRDGIYVGGLLTSLSDLTYQVGPYVQLAPERTWGVQGEKSL